MVTRGKARMDEPLHPSSLSEILDRTAQIYRSRFLVFLGIAVIPTLALVVFAAVAILGFSRLGSNGGSASPAMVGLIGVAFGFGLFLVVLPTMLAATALATAAMSHASARIFMGQAISIRDSYKAVWRRGWSYIGLFVFEIAVVWAVPIGAWFVLTLFSAALAALMQSAGGGGLVILGGVLVLSGLVTYGFWMALRLSLAFPACVVEQIGAWDAIRRSATLTMESKGRILLLYLLGTALNWLLSMALMVPSIFIIALLPGVNSPEHARTMGLVTILVVYGSAFAVQALTRPVYGIALILFYYDQRIRQEAFDIEWMMVRAGLVVPAQPQLAAQPWLPAVAVTAEPAETQAAPAASREGPSATAPNPAPGSNPPDHPEQPPASTNPALGEPA